MEREIEIRVFERTMPAKKGDYPDERDFFKFSKTIDLEEDNIFDVFDEAKAKAKANVAVQAEIAEEDDARRAELFDEEDYRADAGKRQYYHEKYGDDL